MKQISVKDYKAALNPAQWEAVSTVEGPLLVVAGAGTGKTRVIEYRCLYMIEQGIAPESILLLTFTRKAAREMLSRASLHEAKCGRIEGGTFHSFAYRLIQRYKKMLGLGENISFLDESDCADILHLLASRAGFLEDKARFPKKDTLRSILSMSVNRHQGLKEIIQKDFPHFLNLCPQLEGLRSQFSEYKIARNLIDYDDMLIYLRFLLEKEEVRESVSKRYRYCMVDEFQDTNKIQADIIYLLCKSHQNCMAVGDDTQSIYSFRGAYYKNMFDFPSMFEGCRIIKLEYNYRSTQPILDVANTVIEAEKKKYSKVLFTTSPGEEKPTLSYFKDAFSEADFIAAKIKEYRDRGVGLHEMGVLYRSNYLSLPVQLALSKRNLPFAVFGGMKFVETAHIKDVLAFLKVHHNSKDEISLARILMLLEGVGPKTAEKIKDVILGCDEKEFFASFKGITKNTQVVQEASKVRALFDALKKTKDLEGIIKKVNSFYAPYLKKKFDDYPLRQDDLKALCEIASTYSNLEQFLVDFVALEPPDRSVVEAGSDRPDEKPITLSTIHSAKGLEWKVVFLVALIDGSLPVSYSLNDEEALEEERRLLYVAITRAKRHLHLSMHNEGRNGGLSCFNRLSRFISEARVMDRLAMDHVWYEEDPAELDELPQGAATRQGLYKHLMEFFGDTDAQDHF